MVVLTKGHFSLGEYLLPHKGKIITTCLHGPDWDFLLAIIDKRPYSVMKIPIHQAHRPDLIANMVYGNPDLGWYIMLTNKITDPFEALNTGDVIKIASLT